MKKVNRLLVSKNFPLSTTTIDGIRNNKVNLLDIKKWEISFVDITNGIKFIDEQKNETYYPYNFIGNYGTIVKLREYVTDWKDEESL